MRQAGRYMPAYRALREKHTLEELFHNPELAVEVTLLPISLLEVDAAILFSDILVIVEALGLRVEFPESGGPRIVPAIRTKEQIYALQMLDVRHALAYVFEAIERVKEKLSVPLIGFCGGPFTVATYCIDSTSALRWMQEDPMSLHHLLDLLTTLSIAYVQEQVRAGADAIQIFDSWANILSEEQFHAFCLPYLRRIVAALRGLAPVILFCRDSSLRYAALAELEPACISLDGHASLAHLRARIPASIAVQGNISPECLKRSPREIQQSVSHLLDSMRGEKGFIVNLGHGVLPDTPFENVVHFVRAAKELKN
jgi:uroporphyrinogen decarboxylase